MVANPLKVLKEVYEFADLDIKKISKIRLQGKKAMNERGQRQPIGGKPRQVFWYDVDHLQSYIKPSVNKN